MNSSKKIVSVFDTMLLLIIGLFGTAGLMGFNNSGQESSLAAPVAEKKVAELLEQNRQLENELKAREKEAAALESKPAIDPNITQSLAELKAALASAEQIQQEYKKTEAAQKDINDKLGYIAKTFQKSYEQQQFLALLKVKIGDLDSKNEELKHTKEELEASISKVDLQRAESQKLQEKIEKIEKEVTPLQKQIKEMEKKITKVKSHESLWWGRYSGPYILLECNEKGVAAYLPDGSSREIVIDSTEADIDWLKGEIKKIGGAVLAVRPDGFEKSYSKFFEILTAFALEEKKNNHEINLSFWPIGEDEPISTYISKGD